MANHYNFGPRMNFEKLHQHRVNSTTNASEYLNPDSLPTKTNNVGSSDSFMSSTSGLGMHWKKVETKSTTSTDIPSRPQTISSAVSSFSAASTLVPSLRSFGKNGDFQSSSGSQSSESSATMSSGALMRSLMEDTERREEKQCISLQTQGLEELDMTLDRSVKSLSGSNREKQSEYKDIVKNGEAVWGKLDQLFDCLGESVNIACDDFEDKSEKLSEVIDQALNNIKLKQGIEEFVREHEPLQEANLKTLNTLSENEKRVTNIRQILKMSFIDSAPLTTFEKEDQRFEQVFRSLVNMVYGLTLTQDERTDIEHAIQTIEKDGKLDGKMKCEKITRQLFATMSNWEKNNKTTYSESFDSDNWKSVGHFDSGSNVLQNNALSSSFALTDSVIDNDSNLSDLEGEIRSQSIIRAIEGPQNIYECSPWSTGSVENGLSSNASYQTTGEPVSFSSYGITPAVGEISKSSMPNQTLDNSTVLTALSASEPVIPRPPRSIDENSMLQSATGTRTESSNSYNFSDASFGDMIDEALHTAKDASATNLLESLQNSARKCGVPMTDLMTAVSSGSESLSDTQLSNHSITH